MHSLLEERWGQDLIHIAYWEVNLRAVRLELGSASLAVRLQPTVAGDANLHKRSNEFR